MFLDIYDDLQESMPLEADITEHFKSCPECVQEFKFYSQTINDVKNLPEPELPQDFHKIMVGYVKRNIKQKRRAWGWIMPVVSAAASVVFAFMWVMGTMPNTIEDPVPFYGEVEIVGAEISVVPANELFPGSRGFPPDFDEGLPAPELEDTFNLNTIWLSLSVSFAVAAVLVTIFLKLQKSKAVRRYAP